MTSEDLINLFLEYDTQNTGEIETYEMSEILLKRLEWKEAQVAPVRSQMAWRPGGRCLWRGFVVCLHPETAKLLSRQTRSTSVESMITDMSAPETTSEAYQNGTSGSELNI